MEVNNLLANSQSVTHAQLTPPDKLLFPPAKLVGKSAEVIYEYLLKKSKKELKQMLSSESDDTQDGTGSSSDSKDGKPSSPSFTATKAPSPS